MKHRTLTTLLAVLMSMATDVIWADVVVGGLKYSLYGTSATVTGYTEDMPENLVIPETITYDGDTYIVREIYTHSGKYKDGSFGIGTFQNCSKLKSIVFPSGLTSIQDGDNDYLYGVYTGAFMNCHNLEIILFKGSMSIGINAFKRCTSLKNIIFLGGVSSVDYTAFSECGLKQNVIGLSSYAGIGHGNVNDYSLYNSIIWEKWYSTYTGKSPSTPAFTNNLPNGFQGKITGTAEMEKDAGEHTTYIPFTFTIADISFNVEIPYTYTIAPAELNVKVENATRKYGEQNPQFNVRYSGFVNGEGESEISTFPTCTTTATTTSDVGSYPINVSGGSARNYTFTYEGAQLTVTKAPLTLKAKDKDMVYGDKVPTLEMDYDGLKNNESKPKWVYEPQLTTSATSASKVGTYAISISQGEAVNYDLSYKSGTLTVGKAPLTLTANNKRLTYGEGMPNLDYTMTGLKNGESKPEWKREPQIKTTATASSKAGNYPITISSGEATNYELSYENGQLTIDKAQLTVSTKNYTRAYGEANPEFELAYQGFVKGENKSVLFAQPKATTQADKNSDVGTYDITISGGAADNYDFKYVSGKLTIEKAYQTLTWDQELSNMELYQQVELTATASSGLDISYYSSDASVCEIQKVGSRRYINCVGEGETAIYAIQEGNKNYWESSKIYKRVKVVDMTGVGDVLTEDKGTNIYDTNGIKRSTLRKGLNIVRMSDGTVKKVMIK